MPRYFGHCPKDSSIQGGLADLGGKVLRDHSDRLNHLLSLLEIIDAHGRIVAASPKAASLLWRCGKLKGVKPRTLLVAQLFLKLGNGDLDRLHRNPGTVEPSLDDLQAH
jgi:hypothetical protein